MNFKGEYIIMKTNKKMGLVLLSFIFILTASCGTDENTSSSNTSSSDTSASETVLSEISSSESKSVGQTLLDSFNETLNENPSVRLEELADSILSNDIIQFEGVQTPVENGLLTGFGNTEITGFKDGIMFSPMIGSIPFVGYVFKLEDGSNAKEFTQMLKDNADLRWNICTEADEMIADYSGDTVFFIMCPKSFE